jgi:hypothetical protein
MARERPMAEQAQLTKTKRQLHHSLAGGAHKLAEITLQKAPSSSREKTLTGRVIWALQVTASPSTDVANSCEQNAPDTCL